MQQQNLYANLFLLHKVLCFASLAAHQVEPRWSSQSSAGDEGDGGSSGGVAGGGG